VVGPKLYFMCTDIEPSFWAHFLTWMARKHCPDLLGVGFWSAMCFESVEGSQRIWDIYEIPNVAILSTPAYQSLQLNDPELEDIMPRFSNRTVTLYQQLVVGSDKGEPRGARLEAPALTAVRFDAPGIDDATVVEWFRDVHLARLSATTGFLHSRLCKQDGQHPKWPSSEPTWCRVTGWVSLEAAAATDPAAAATREHETALSGAMSRVSYNRLVRQLGLQREDV